MKCSSQKSLVFVSMAIITIVVLILCDRGIGYLMKYLYFNQQSGDGYLVTYAIDSTEADILVLGSSRAKHSYDPEVIEDSTKYSCFNAGRDGTEHLLFNYGQFMAITSRYNPKIVILDLRPEDLAYSAKEYDMLSPLLPYYRTHGEIRELMLVRGPFEKLKHISAIYPFNSLIFQVVMGNLEMNKGRKVHYNGYVPFPDGKVEGQIDTLPIHDIALDKYKIGVLENMIRICNEKEIRLIFVYSPTWHIVTRSPYDAVLTELCNKKQIDYLNLSNHPDFLTNPGYFYDRTHLNDNGAKIFTSMLIRKISLLDNQKDSTNHQQ
jgi:hypothetical protein